MPGRQKLKGQIAFELSRNQSRLLAREPAFKAILTVIVPTA
jgi:hypothetical protein